MIPKELIERINELSRKNRSEGLTEEEQLERDNLRRQYVEAMRTRFKDVLDNVKVVSPEDVSTSTAQVNGLADKQSCSCGCGEKKLH
ncbi:DUF896 domain-containing protein [Heliorestis acidaminivorans]|uniref:UPF0291 protein F9B85_09520 n=1 Tax=Heliorestis acidaminivorans TaxID=553427 RepID=A0A6I0ERU5_9FIRM|nr:DUF896 domain-containing protein [Heliorestis acidaminivorans]KAB2952383.1 DUF896 domain-containing protein [Heliorestis acidaminivorans]